MPGAGVPGAGPAGGRLYRLRRIGKGQAGIKALLLPWTRWSRALCRWGFLSVLIKVLLYWTDLAGASMNRKLLLGALVGAGISMLNKKRRQAPQTRAPNIPPPDFSRVPPPTGGSLNRPQDSGLDDIFGRHTGRGSEGTVPGGARRGGDVFGGSTAGAGAAGAGGATVLMDIARRIFQEMQQRGGSQAAPRGGNLTDLLGQIFGRTNGKFGQQGPLGPAGDSRAWQGAGQGELFGFAANDSGAEGEEQAELMLHAMVAAAQADGRIDEHEQRNILSSLEGQLDQDDLTELRELMTTPVNIDRLVDRVNDPATAFDMYLVSAMTINEDNPREHEYMDRLAEKLGISEQAAQMIEQQVPKAA